MPAVDVIRSCLPLFSPVPLNRCRLHPRCRTEQKWTCKGDISWLLILKFYIFRLLRSERHSSYRDSSWLQRWLLARENPCSRAYRGRDVLLLTLELIQAMLHCRKWTMAHELVELASREIQDYCHVLGIAL